MEISKDNLSEDAAEDKKRIEKKTNESTNFFYSEKLQKFISFKPLLIDDRAVKAASELGIELDWDDEGRIRNISFADAKELAQRLGSRMLSPREFWTVYNEAIEK